MRWPESGGRARGRPAIVRARGLGGVRPVLLRGSTCRCPMAHWPRCSLPPAPPPLYYSARFHALFGQHLTPTRAFWSMKGAYGGRAEARGPAASVGHRQLPPPATAVAPPARENPSGVGAAASWRWCVAGSLCPPPDSGWRVASVTERQGEAGGRAGACPLPVCTATVIEQTLDLHWLYGIDVTIGADVSQEQQRQRAAAVRVHPCHWRPTSSIRWS